MQRGGTFFLLAAALAIGGGVRADDRPRGRNVVVILADDLGWSDLGVYGADLHETPQLDQLAQGGVRFTQAYAAAPVCTPTRAAIMTGKAPARLRMTIWREAAAKPPQNRRLIPPTTVADLPHDEITLAEALQKAGYLTAIVGKWHLGGAEHYPEAQGFDINIGGTLWGAPATYFWPYRGQQTFREMRYVPHLEWGRPGEYLTDRLTDEALKIVERAGDRPFFLYLAHHAVHTPIEAKDERVAHFASKITPEMHHRNATYAAMVENLDENVGGILEGLERLGRSDDTVVVFTSDNGGYIQPFDKMQVTDNYPLRSGKGALYEGGIRVPLIVRWPGVTPAGTVCEEPVVSTDLYATLLEMAGVAPEHSDGAAADGLNLAPLLRDPQTRLEREALYWHYPHYYATTAPVSAVRARQWKLIEHYEDGRVELFDLASDPREEKDLAAAMPERAGEFRERLHEWLKSVDAQMPERR